MKFFSSKRRVLAAAVVILLGLFVLRPGVSQLKARITNSISRAVARPADVGDRLGFLAHVVLHFFDETRWGRTLKVVR